MRTQGTPRVSAVPGAPPGRAHFLILPIGYTMADVKWLVTRDPDDSEAALEADLERDGRRRRWLGAGVAGPDSQR